MLGCRLSHFLSGNKGYKIVLEREIGYFQRAFKNYGSGGGWSDFWNCHSPGCRKLLWYAYIALLHKNGVERPRPLTRQVKELKIDWEHIWLVEMGAKLNISQYVITWARIVHAHLPIISRRTELYSQFSIRRQPILLEYVEKDKRTSHIINCVNRWGTHDKMIHIHENKYVYYIWENSKKDHWHDVYRNSKTSITT